MIIVPDASVILKWVLEKEDEPDHRQAFRLQEALVAEQVKSDSQPFGAMKSGMCWG